MGSAIKMMGIILAVVQGLALLIGSIGFGFAGVVIIIVGGCAVVLSTMIILAIGNTLENTEALRSAINTLTYKIERMEKSDNSAANAHPASNGSQGGYSIPTWQRVEMEREQKLKDQKEL